MARRPLGPSFWRLRPWRHPWRWSFPSLSGGNLRRDAAPGRRLGQLDDLALMQRHAPVHARGEIEIMRRDQRGEAARLDQRGERREDMVGGLGIEIAGRLVR